MPTLLTKDSMPKYYSAYKYIYVVKYIEESNLILIIICWHGGL